MKWFRLTIFVACLGSSLLFFQNVSAAIPATERAILITLYNSTNGDSWSNNYGWKLQPLASDGFALPGTEDDWRGIQVTEDPSDGDHVTGIQLSNHNLTGVIPPVLGNLIYLESLYLSNNPFSSTLPSELGNLLNLELFQIVNCQLTGTIPNELGKLSEVSSIALSYNQLTGSIPKSFNQLKKLDLLDLGHNALTGTIPPEIVGMESVEYLYLNNNHLSGNIPSEMGNLTNLIYIYLSHNQLSGPVPGSFMNLTNVYESTLDIGYNCLTASDSGLRDWLAENDPDWEDHQNDCGGVPLLTTAPVQYITETTAYSGGEVTLDGGFSVTSRGVCWKTAPNPTILDAHTTDGSGMGTFYSSLDGLSPGETYHIKAWATNTTGTGYGEEVMFTTKGGSHPVIPAALILLLGQD